MTQRYNDNTKTPKPQHSQLGFLKIYTFCWKKQQKALGLGESAAGVMNLSLRIHQKICLNFPLKDATTLPSGSWKGAVVA